MSVVSSFSRHRRLRISPAIRSVLQENRLHPANLMAPFFVTDSEQLAGPISSLPGVRRYLVSELADAVRIAADTGIQSVILFGVPGHKRPDGSGASNEEGVVPRAIHEVRTSGTDVVIAADVCLCQYTSHGHCGLLSSDGSEILNDETLELIGRISLTYAQAGASLIAPSGMIDGTVSTIRQSLDASGYKNTGILAYSVKHASAFYGPFRDAARSTPASGDRRSHQLDPANAREAMREAESDLAEGADIIMVKPALTNLDTLVRLRTAHPHAPLAAYEVSGEYAMLEAAAAQGWLDRKAASLEALMAMKRAGADMIISYRAVEVARWLSGTG